MTRWTITKHIPGWVEHTPDEAPVAEFDTLEELLEIPWVKSWKKYEGFHRFSMSVADLPVDPPRQQVTIMVEYDDGYRWRVVGFIQGNPELALPVWAAKQRPKEQL